MILTFRVKKMHSVGQITVALPMHNDATGAMIITAGIINAYCTRNEKFKTRFTVLIFQHKFHLQPLVVDYLINDHYSYRSYILSDYSVTLYAIHSICFAATHVLIV